MPTNFVSIARRCRPFFLTIGLASLAFQLPAQDSKTVSDQLSASTWGAIPPPSGDMIVGFYKDPTAMIGLNHVYAESEKLTHRWRSFVPWMSSEIVSVFPFNNAIESVPSRTPVLYVGHVAAWVSAEPDDRWVHLVRAETKNNSRVVQITSGWSTFSFHPGLPTRDVIPLKFHILSDNIYTIEPERPLENGEYLVIFGPSAQSGFEFQIACSGTHCD